MLHSDAFHLINIGTIVGGQELAQSNELFINHGIVSLRNPALSYKVLDLKGAWVVPGFFDPQFNGSGPCNIWDLCNNNAEIIFEQLDQLRMQCAYEGVTRFLPTIITAPLDVIQEQVRLLSTYIATSHEKPGAEVVGIHIEGVFITRYGVHNPSYAQTILTPALMEPIINEHVKLFTLAPELDSAGDSIRLLQRSGVQVSIGHSNGSYREGMKAIYEHDVHLVTHMFNALRGCVGFDHRSEDPNTLLILEKKLNNSSLVDEDRDGILLALLKASPLLKYLLNADGRHVSNQVMKFLACKAEAYAIIPTPDMVADTVHASAQSQGILGGGRVSFADCMHNLLTLNYATKEETLLTGSLSLASVFKEAKGLGSITLGQAAHISIIEPHSDKVLGSLIGNRVFLRPIVYF